MTDEREARRRLTQARSVVIKIGTRVIAAEDAGLNREFLDGLAAQVSALRERGVVVVIVTSGAVHLGRRALAHRGRASVSARQAMAAVGQPELMRNYSEAFGARNLIVAQLLLTAADMVETRERERYLSVRNTIDSLLHDGVVPVINENDSVSIEGVTATFGENDRLAALVAIAFRAEALILLSDQPGLFDRDPRSHGEARLIPAVLPGQDLPLCAGDAGGPESAGGMAAKLDSALMAARCGIPVVIARGHEPDVVLRILGGEEVGTVFVAGPRMAAWDAYLSSTAEPRGEVLVDDGAARALLDPDGASLLPVGVREVKGDFERGDLVTIHDLTGREIARGLVNYSADELRRIAGHRTRDIERILGRRGDDEAVHRDNMAVTAARSTP
jgi:glutamate 5-kinase